MLNNIMKKFALISLYPKYIDSAVSSSILGRACENNLISILSIDLKNFAPSMNRVDDHPFGGGSGMVIRADVVVDAVNYAKEICGENSIVVFVSPRGEQFDHIMAKDMSKDERNIIFVSGHYEGIDQRAIQITNGVEFSVGYAIVTTGCIPSLYMIDAISRYVPGTLGNPESLEGETNYLDGIQCDLYTKPREYRGIKVPDVLLSGHHANIEKWKNSFRRSRDK